MTKKKEKRSDKIINWIELLRITIGKDAGKPFKLREWQKAFIRDVYDSVDHAGRRKVRRAILSIARKNGKSELAAALVLVHLCGPEAELNGEIIAAANSRDQASVVFNAVKRLIEASPQLAELVEVVGSTKRVFVKRSDLPCRGSYFMAISADAGTKHGLNPSFVIYDELAQAKSRELLDTLLTAQGARDEPLFLTISTQNNDPQHPLSEMIDDTLVAKDPTVICHLYAADDDCDLLDDEQWKKANPALGDFRSRQELSTMAHRAARLPAEEASFRLLYLNQRVSLHAPLIAQSDWKRRYSETCALRPGEPIYLGLDMSQKNDLTALLATSATDGSRVQGWYWKPAEFIQEHSKRDRFRYDLAVDKGYMIAGPGRTVDPRSVARKIIELATLYDVRGLAFDRYGIDQILRHFDGEGFTASVEGKEGGLRLVAWGQGFAYMSPAVAALEEAVLTSDLQHDGNSITTFCMMNAQVISDAAGNRKLDKSATRFRIDGAVALAMALGLKAKDRPEPTIVNPFEDPNFSLSMFG